MDLPGCILPQSDLDQLARCGVDPEVVISANWRRVDTFTGAQIVGRNGRADYAGIAIPYFWPGSQNVREFRLRRDNPEVELLPNGEKKFKNKYLSPPNRENKFYFHPYTRPAWLDDVALPIVLTEGEKKALALWGLSWHALEPHSQLPRWLPVGIAGVWSWKGSAGKTEGPTGRRLNVTGTIRDLDRINWKDRSVIIIFDANVHTNSKVKAARRELAKELRQRGARAFFVDVPEEPGIKGIDDLIGIWGLDRVLYFVDAATYEDSSTNGRVVIGCIPSVRSLGAMRIEFLVQGLIAKGAVHLFTGDSGHGKSTLITALAGAIAGGVEFAGRSCAQTPVLILDRENPRSVVAERLDRLGVQDGNALQIWGGWNIEEPPDLGCKQILCWVRQTEPKPLIVGRFFHLFSEGR